LRLFFRTRAAAAACLVLFLSSCARRAAAPAIERLAVLRFENLGADSRTDWMGRAFAEILTAELASAPGIYAIPSSRVHALGQTLGRRPIEAPGISAEAPLALAAGANRLAYGVYYLERGTIHATLNIEDPSTRRMVQVVEATAPDPDVAAAATALARRVWPQAQPYPVRNPAAIEAFAAAVEASDVNTQEALARQAIAADADYGSAYLLLADLKARQHDRAGLVHVLEAASARGTALPAADRARLEVFASGLSDDRAARERALAVIARLTPNDPVAWTGLAETFAARHQNAQAAQVYQRALAIQPEDVNLWNQLAYTQAAAGNLPSAVAALRRYQALRPTDANPLDSLGDVHLISGRLKEAEQFYLDAAKISPAFLNGADFYKAAMAHLMTGDVAGADAIYAKYPAAAQHRPEWLWISGRRRQAYATLSAALDGMPPELRPGGYAELAVWSLLDGNRSAAASMAQKAGAGPLGALVRFLAMPAAQPVEWASRAQQLFPGAAVPEGQPQPRNLALAYALLLNDEFQPAAALLRNIYDRAGSSPEATTPFELAWALVETGDFEHAGPLLRVYPVPSINGPSALLSVSFPRIFRLRAQLAEREGKTAEAHDNQHIFELLATP
jgi:Flp pilus assembly protein TadD